MEERIRAILGSDALLGPHAQSVSVHDDLQSAGIDSFRTVQIMFEVEEMFGIEFPDHLLKPEMFRSIDSIIRAVREASGPAVR
jgi:acyl carrier protein